MTTRPDNVPFYAEATFNPDGSVSWRWRDEDGFNTFTVNCPPAPPIYFNPTNGIPIPPAPEEQS